MKKEVRVADPNHPSNMGVDNLTDMVWEVEQADDQYQKVFIGNVPLMLQSFYCTLNGLEDSELERMGECPYDQVEQFAILLLTLYI
jgi:DNA-directed RNA polymerase II subunit RPB2